jgi:hypothetical protein
VERVEIKDVRLPVQLQRAMAAEAEVSEIFLYKSFELTILYLYTGCPGSKVSEIFFIEFLGNYYNVLAYRAKVIAAEGEQKASRALREASEVIGNLLLTLFSPLRCTTTLNSSLL